MDNSLLAVRDINHKYIVVEGNPLYNPNRHAMMLEVMWDEGKNPIFEF